MSTLKKLIPPTQPSGMIDFLPTDQIPRLAIIDVVRRVYERFGFDPLETPVIERLDVLTGNPDDFDMKLWQTYPQGTRSVSGHERALRFDLTVPLARVVAANPDLPIPFKRWAYGRVMRGEDPQVDKGRYCEFAQLDADIVGAESVLADAEIIDVMCRVMRELGFTEQEFFVRFNNRKLLNGLPELVGFAVGLLVPVLRVIDKYDKIGRDQVLKQLRVLTTEKGGNTVEIARFTDDQLDRFAELLDITGCNTISRLNEAARIFSGIAVAEEGIAELRIIAGSLDRLGILDTQAVVDFSIARGLGYYTGPVFETMLTGVPEIGSVYSGGRYNGLVERFSDRRLPATGASVGVDRLLVGLRKLGKLSDVRSMTQVLVLNLGDNYGPEYQDIAQALRNAGVRVSIYYGSEARIGGQLGYADRLGAHCAVILGERELSTGFLGLKNLRTKAQQKVSFRQGDASSYEELVTAVADILRRT